MAKQNKNKKNTPQDDSVAVVFTVRQEDTDQKDDKTFWVLVACPAEKIDVLEASYALMLNADSEINLESVLKDIGAEVRDYGDVENVVVNGQVVGQKIPDNIIKIASRVIGKEKDDPELPTHPQTYMPGNDNTP